jgi:spore coat protein U domain-containing protein, fimbrial subunit CupE1/2/3/6
MNPLLTRCLFCLLLGMGLLHAPHAHAQVTCSATMSNVTFGAIDPQSSQTPANATLKYSCTNTSNSTQSVRLCFDIGDGAQGQGLTDPRQMLETGGGVLQFQLYQDAAFTTPWGSTGFGVYRTPYVATLTIPKRANGSGSWTMYGRVMNGQTGAEPASYQNDFHGIHTSLNYSYQQSNTAPGSCTNGNIGSGGTFGFVVTAAVPKQCTVIAGPTLNLGATSGVDSTVTNITGSNTLNVTCTSGTVYNIGLLPQSTGNTTGAGLMTGTGSNTDKVPYQLRSTTGLSGTIWGNTATPTSVGNGVTGSGNGNSQSLTVYATAPSANYSPDTYADTVIVYVYY